MTLRAVAKAGTSAAWAVALALLHMVLTKAAEVRMKDMQDGKGRRAPALLTNLSIEVQRVFGGEKRTVFTYVGDVDAARIAIVLDHVERLCAAVSGEWYVEVESTTPGPLLFRALTQRFTDLGKRRVRERFRVVSTPGALAPSTAESSAAAQWYRPFPQAPW